LFILVLGVASFAQNQTFTVGERVEYKDKSWPTEVWKEGTIVKVMPEYHQVVVHWDPRDDYPSYTRNGVSIYEQAYNMDSVRPITRRRQPIMAWRLSRPKTPAKKSRHIRQRTRRRAAA